MFYTITEVSDHPCYEMQNILKIFFEQTLQGADWNLNNQHTIVSKIDGRSNFVDLLKTLHNELTRRNDFVRQSINQQFVNNNNIESLCNNTLQIQDIIAWDISIGKKIKEFFQDSYPKKLDLNIFKREGCDIQPTKRFYQDFIARNGHICPFCSILPHKNPFGNKRGDFDHYLDKDTYPMAALNLDNLIPMCNECNQDYKHMANILKNEDDSRRIFIYPYSLDKPFRIEIDSIVQDERIWKFNINIIADLDPIVVSNFDKVFKIKERIQREIQKRYDAWLMQEIKRYTFENGSVSINGFKAYLLNTAMNVLDLNNRTLETILLEHSLYIYLGNTEINEINEIFLGSYLFEYIN